MLSLRTRTSRLTNLDANSQLWYNAGMEIKVTQLPRWKRRTVIAVTLPFLLIAQTAMVVPALFRAYKKLVSSAVQKWNHEAN